MKILTAFFVFLLTLSLTISPCHAKTVYVVNNNDLPLRANQTGKGTILGLVPVGAAVEVLSENPATGLSRIRLKSGTEGFIATRNTILEPVNRIKLETTTRNLESLQTENAVLKEELTKVKASIIPGNTLEQSLLTERDRLDRELTDIKRTAANQIQLRDERDKLQEDLVNVKRELEQIKLENHALKDGSNQDWFLYGGFLALSGVILGFILPKLGWRRRSNWDRL